MQLENLTTFDSNFTLAFDTSGREMVVVAARGTYDFPDDPEGVCTPAADQRPLVMADELGDEPGLLPLAETDFAPFKPACDVLVMGRAFAPEGRPVTRMIAGIELGRIKKYFAVVGSRVWEKRFVGHAITEAKPFTEQPIDYGHAWGGVDPHPSKEGIAATCELNPSGVGYYPYRSDLTGLPLPHTETPDTPINDAESNHIPMSLGPIGRVWLPRRSYAGTYDEAWQNTRMPFPPKDLDSRYFQSAPPDQQMAYPAGGERFRLRGLAPEGDLIGCLPRTKVTMRFTRKSGRITQKIAQPDTIIFYPEDRQLTITWRANLKPDRDLFDIAGIDVMADHREEVVDA